MLQFMRGIAKYIWWFVFLAFVGGFLLYETSGLLGTAPVTASTIVAEVNGTEIPYVVWEERIRGLSQQQEQRLGRAMNMDDRQVIEQQAFDELVLEVLLQQEYKKRKISVSDQEIIDAAKFSPPPQLLSNPELQTDGRFDPVKYQRFLDSPVARQQGLLAQLEAYYRQDIPRTKLYSQLVSDAYVSDAKLWQDYRDENDSARVSFVALRPDSAQVAAATVSDAEARAFYDSMKDRWKVPGQAVVSVITLSRAPTAADTAAIVAKLRALRDEITSGRTSFSDVAKRESEDTISGTQGGDLGRGGRGRFVAEFERAAYALRAGQISEPVRTSFGYHLIQVTEKKGDTLAMRHILLRVKQRDSVATVTDRAADRLASLAAGATEPAKFDTAARDLGLLVTQIPVAEGQMANYLGRGIAGVSGWVFSGSNVGDVSDLFDDENGYYLVRLDSLKPGGDQPFEAMKDDIVTALKERKAVDGLLPKGEALLADAKGTTLEAAAAKAGLQVAKAGPFNRLRFVPGLGLYNEAIGAAFALPVGATGLAKTTEAVIVMRVDSRKDAVRAEFELQKATQRQQTVQAMREQRVRGYLEALRKHADVDDRRKTIMASLRRQSAAN